MSQRLPVTNEQREEAVVMVARTRQALEVSQ